jgi:hypothetical protein
MNTPAHLIFAAAAFASPEKRIVTFAALAGGLFPDLSLYLLAGFNLFILGVSGDIVFGEMYYSDQWQQIFAIDNSFFVWGALFALGLGVKWPVLWAFAGGALLHLLLDFPLHHDDGRAHFWPLTTWIFESPLSYWDRNHYGHIVAPIEAAMVVAALVYLWRKFTSTLERVIFTILAAMEVLPAIIFTIMFSGS